VPQHFLAAVADAQRLHRIRGDGVVAHEVAEGGELAHGQSLVGMQQVRIELPAALVAVVEIGAGGAVDAAQPVIAQLATLPRLPAKADAVERLQVLPPRVVAEVAPVVEDDVLAAGTERHGALRVIHPRVGDARGGRIGLGRVRRDAAGTIVVLLPEQRPRADAFGVGAPALADVPEVTHLQAHGVRLAALGRGIVMQVAVAVTRLDVRGAFLGCLGRERRHPRHRTTGHAHARPPPPLLHRLLALPSTQSGNVGRVVGGGQGRDARSVGAGGSRCGCDAATLFEDLRIPV
jgi:hypothetical protein